MLAHIRRWSVKLHARHVRQANLRRALTQQHVLLVAQALTLYQARALAPHRVQAVRLRQLAQIVCVLLAITASLAHVLPVQLAA